MVYHPLCCWLTIVGTKDYNGFRGVNISPFTGLHGVGPFPEMFKSSHCNSLEGWAPMDFISAWSSNELQRLDFMTEYQYNSSNNGKHAQLTTKQYIPHMLYFTPNIMDPLLLGILSSMATTKLELGQTPSSQNTSHDTSLWWAMWHLICFLLRKIMLICHELTWSCANHVHNLGLYCMQQCSMVVLHIVYHCPSYTAMVLVHELIALHKSVYDYIVHLIWQLPAIPGTALSERIS